MKLLEAAKKYEKGKPFIISWRGDNYDTLSIAQALDDKQCACGNYFDRWGIIGHPHPKPKGRGKEFIGVFVCDDCLQRIHKAIVKYFPKKEKKPCPAP